MSGQKTFLITGSFGRLVDAETHEEALALAKKMRLDEWAYGYEVKTYESDLSRLNSGKPDVKFFPPNSIEAKVAKYETELQKACRPQE